MAWETVGGLWKPVGGVWTGLAQPASGFVPSAVSGYLAHVDASDLSTLWQDESGTVPVTTLGQPVRRVDVPASSLFFVAPSDAARPTWESDGTYHWLDFDGVDDTLSMALSAAASSVLAGVAIRSVGEQTWPGIVKVDADSNTLVRSFLQQLGGFETLRAEAQFPSGNKVAADTGPFIDSDGTVIKLLDGATENTMLYKNGALINSMPWNGTTDQIGTITNVSIANTLAWRGRFYGAIFTSATPTAQELTDIGAWLDDRRPV